jgi:hypothetical protein
VVEAWVGVGLGRHGELASTSRGTEN